MINLILLLTPRKGCFGALKFAMEDGLCRIKWQAAASPDRDAPWFGHDGGVGTPGFVVMPCVPRGAPKKIKRRANAVVR